MKKPGVPQAQRSASTTFRADEVEAMVRMFRRLDTPATQDLVKDVTSVRGKFLRMQQAIEKAKQEGPCDQPQTSENT